MAELERVAKLDRGRDVGDAEVVAVSGVHPDGDSDHKGMVASGPQAHQMAVLDGCEPSARLWRLADTRGRVCPAYAEEATA